MSAALVKKMFDETGCDAVAVARGALGNPWIFKELNAFFKRNKIFKKPSINERTKTMVEHLKSCVDFHGTKRGVVIFRKFFNWYTKGFSEVRALREKACHAKTIEETLKIIEEFRMLHDERFASQFESGKT